jgi:TusA-related sulfurtransferase
MERFRTGDAVIIGEVVNIPFDKNLQQIDIVKIISEKMGNLQEEIDTYKADDQAKMEQFENFIDNNVRIEQEEEKIVIYIK